MSSVWLPSRDAGLAQLQRFLPRAGRHYAGERNDDHGPESRHNVSTLSPFIRHRLISEKEVVQTVLAVHGAKNAGKFVDEVLWRGYWKGWLEHHPQVWETYLDDVRLLSAGLRKNNRFTKTYALATTGKTGIKPFDAWVHELLETGYLHNHARMWFASIWIFTLELPWQLGADFFLRALLDGDPAVNTLSWRWVAGLHTKGKTYLATKANIARYTQQRFDETLDLPSLDVLSKEAVPCQEPMVPELHDINYPPYVSNPNTATCAAGGALILTEEDLDLEVPFTPAAVVALDIVEPQGLPRSERVGVFKQGALADTLRRAAQRWPDAQVCQSPVTGEAIVEYLTHRKEAISPRVMMAYCPQGYTQPVLARLSSRLACEGFSCETYMQEHDRLVWPHTQKGFFNLRKRIPQLLEHYGDDSLIQCSA